MRHRADWTKLAQSLADNTVGRKAAEAYAAPVDVPRGTKYGNRTAVVDGHRFDSRLEADRYCELKLLKASGEVLWFTRQVPFVLAAPGALFRRAVTYRADFLVVWRHAGPTRSLVTHSPSWVHVTVEDTKGYLTEAARAKLALVESLYGVTVRLLKRADVQRFGGGA